MCRKLVSAVHNTKTGTLLFLSLWWHIIFNAISFSACVSVLFLHNITNTSQPSKFFQPPFNFILVSHLRQVGLIFTFGHWRFAMESRMLNTYTRFSIVLHVYTNCFNKIMIKNELST